MGIATVLAGAAAVGPAPAAAQNGDPSGLYRCRCEGTAAAGEQYQAIVEMAKRDEADTVLVVRSRPTIMVKLFDHAGLAAELLTGARKQVSQLYDDVGVHVQWSDDAAVTDPEGRFLVRLIIRPTGRHPRKMGTALGDSREKGGTAFVYRDRVLEVARGRDIEPTRLMAYAMAHEIGHLLLPYPFHAVAGIMKSDWSSDELRDIGAGTLRFTLSVASAIRSKAHSTVAQQPADLPPGTVQKETRRDPG